MHLPVNSWGLRLPRVSPMPQRTAAAVAARLLLELSQASQVHTAVMACLGAHQLTFEGTSVPDSSAAATASSHSSSAAAREAGVVTVMPVQSTTWQPTQRHHNNASNGCKIWYKVAPTREEARQRKHGRVKVHNPKGRCVQIDGQEALRHLLLQIGVRKWEWRVSHLACVFAVWQSN